MNKITSQVILATGELCPKFELKPGMMLLGAESQPLILNGIETRRLPAFEVKPLKSESFFVGLDQKILATSKTNSPLLLTAKDYVEFSKNLQQKFSLAKAALDFPETELPLDPYLLGLLLGDGCFCETPIKITTPDSEVIEAIYEIAAQNNWPVSVNHLANNLSNHYRIKCPPKEQKSLKDIIVSLGLFNHKSPAKFIPKQYLFADKKSRQEFLAGLLDADGYLATRYYDFKTSSQQLAADTAFLARSLGLTVIENHCPQTRGCIARLYIHGNFSEIPLRIHRKVARVSKKHFERFSAKPAGIQEIQYLDIESYLLGNCTVRIGDSI
jgi:replicative DNA helicase